MSQTSTVSLPATQPSDENAPVFPENAKQLLKNIKGQRATLGRQMEDMERSLQHKLLQLQQGTDLNDFKKTVKAFHEQIQDAKKDMEKYWELYIKQTADATVEEKKMEELKKELDAIEDHYSRLPEELDRLQTLEVKKREELKRYNEQLCLALSQGQTRTEYLQTTCQKYQKNLGVSFAVVEGERFRVIFRGLYPDNVDKECWVTLGIDNENQMYKVINSEPVLFDNNYEELEKDINSKAAQFGKLVVTLRLAFQKHFAQK